MLYQNRKKVLELHIVPYCKNNRIYYGEFGKNEERKSKLNLFIDSQNKHGRHFNLVIAKSFVYHNQIKPVTITGQLHAIDRYQ